MKSLIQFTLAIFLSGPVFFPAHAAFTSFYVFGDSLSCTATNPQSGLQSGTLYYGNRFSNGRVWVEVLAQSQGLAFNPAGNTNSFFGNTSITNLPAEINKFTAPPDASNALVVIWVNNADLFFPALNDTPTLAGFTPFINLAQTNHYSAITNLYAKGIRTLIMPNVVDISSIPAFNTSRYTNIFYQAATNYNAAFYATLDRARTNCPGLTIYMPDFFALLTNLLARPATYGVTNFLGDGLSVDAADAFNFGPYPLASTNGFGTNFIFWDQKNPSAKVHYTMAGVANAMISPPVFAGIVPVSGSNRLDLTGLPVASVGATNCFVLYATNLNQTAWQTNLPGFTSLTANQSVFVPADGTQRFYRLKSRLEFSWPWVWP